MYVYAISSIIKKYIYVGMSQNVDERFARHNSGREKTTKSYTPYSLIFTTYIKERITARLIEKYLKSGYGKEFLREMIK